MGSRAAPLFDGSRAGPLADALVRALEWIGSSITRESYDDKVVDLCTAMECMLTSEDDRLKGQAIALRYIMLIEAGGGGTYVNPRAVLPVYELRSSVIHGARRRIASGVHYSAMMEVCIAAFEATMRLLDARPAL